MSDVVRCSQCGVELAQDAASQGLCAACLLQLGLSSMSLPAAEPAKPIEQIQQPSRRCPWKRIAAIAAALAAAIVIVVGLTFLFPNNRASNQQQVLRFSLFPANAEDFALSPDGLRLVFAARNSEGKRILWIRPLDAFVDAPLVETEDAAAPFWSPDSRHVGFFARGKLKKIDIARGAAEIICDAPTGKGGSWSSSGVIVFSRDSLGPLFVVRAQGGIPEPASKLDPREGSHRWPHFLPDGRHFLFTWVTSNADHDGVFVASTDSADVKQLLEARSAAQYSENSLLFVRRVC